MAASPVTEALLYNGREGAILLVFLLAASVRSVSWLCDSKRSYFESSKSSVALAVLLLGSTIMSGCLGGDDWDKDDLDFQDYREYENYICYDGIAIWDCYDFPETWEQKSSETHIFSGTNGDLLKLNLSSHEDSSGMAIVTVTAQDTSDSFKLRSGNTESGIFEISGTGQYLEVQLEADNGWFGDIVHYTIEVQRDTTYRDTDLDGYIDTVDFCGYQYGTSSISHLGCPDSDGDGWSNTDEYACNTSSELRNHTPLDLDGNGICNYLDLDDDGDGWEDTEELSCGADPLSPNSIPVVTSADECHAILLEDGGFWESARGPITGIVMIGALLMILPNRPTEPKLEEKPKLNRYKVAKPKPRPIPRPAEEGIIGVFRKDVDQATYVNSQNDQTIGDVVASSGLVGRDGTPWSIIDRSGRHIDKDDPASSFWSQNVSVVFQ